MSVLALERLTRTSHDSHGMYHILTKTLTDKIQRRNTETQRASQITCTLLTLSFLLLSGGGLPEVELEHPLLMEEWQREYVYGF